nr:MAG TPA: hypothetical protein [Caudoviricetes sp.]
MPLKPGGRLKSSVTACGRVQGQAKDAQGRAAGAQEAIQCAG